MKTVRKNARFQICVLTTTRADYGILRRLLLALSEDDSLELRLAVTGTHLSEAFGMTVQEIEADGVPIDVKIPILQGPCDSPAEMSRVMAKAAERFGAYFQARRPDLLVVLGDRYEAFAVCAAAVSAIITAIRLKITKIPAKSTASFPRIQSIACPVAIGR